MVHIIMDSNTVHRAYIAIVTMMLGHGSHDTHHLSECTESYGSHSSPIMNTYELKYIIYYCA